jgi:hypothetical protein
MTAASSSAPMATMLCHTGPHSMRACGSKPASRANFAPPIGHLARRLQARCVELGVDAREPADGVADGVERGEVARRFPHGEHDGSARRQEAARVLDRAVGVLGSVEAQQDRAGARHRASLRAVLM